MPEVEWSGQWIKRNKKSIFKILIENLARLGPFWPATSWIITDVFTVPWFADHPRGLTVEVTTGHHRSPQVTQRGHRPPAYHPWEGSCQRGSKSHQPAQRCSAAAVGYSPHESPRVGLHLQRREATDPCNSKGGALPGQCVGALMGHGDSSGMPRVLLMIWISCLCDLYVNYV